MSRSAPLRGWLAWVFRPTLCFGGLAAGLVFFWLSLTPSLLPRSWVAQGLVGGLSIATGYGIGSAISALYRSRHWAEPSRSAKRVAWWSLGGAAVVVSVLLLLWSQGWQSDLLERVGLPPDLPVSRIGIVLIAIVIALVALLVSRLVRSGTRFLIRQVGRVAPPRVSVAVGVALAVVLIVGLAQGVL